MKDMNNRGLAYKIQLISYSCTAAFYWVLAIVTMALGEVLIAGISTVLATVLSLRCRHLTTVGFASGQDHFAMLFYAPIAGIHWVYRGYGVPEEWINYSTIAWLVTSLPLWYEFIRHVIANRRNEARL